jgi:predicted Zn-dependent protease
MADDGKRGRTGAGVGGAGGRGGRKSPQALAEEGKPEEAVIMHLRRIEKNPEQGVAYVKSLPLLMKLKLPRLAGMIGQKALSAGVTNAGIYLWLARAKRAEGDRDGALATVKAGLATHPGNRQLQNLKARIEEGPVPTGG